MFDFYHFQGDYHQHCIDGIYAVTDFRMALEPEVEESEGPPETQLSTFRDLEIDTVLFDAIVKEFCEEIIKDPGLWADGKATVEALYDEVSVCLSRS